jgi:hypothetical protein
MKKLVVSRWDERQFEAANDALCSRMGLPTLCSAFSLVRIRRRGCRRAFMRVMRIYADFVPDQKMRCEHTIISGSSAGLLSVEG